ncbi:MAG: allophanate hydrolase subunit 1 [Phycisphaerales bacterium]|nr:allophanate hydrolase subunit 1 [Phycisphaerales bacterium]
MTGHEFQLHWVSERHLRITAERPDAVVLLAAWRELRRERIDHVVDVTLGYDSVVIACDPTGTDWDAVENAVQVCIGRPAAATAGRARVVRIAVCYDAAVAPDLADVARLSGLTVDRVIAEHAGSPFCVRFIGFSPGFAYLDGLSKALRVPRLESPRVRVPAGSVAIAADQAGIYPSATPGGWRIIGRSPVRMFDASRAAPSVLEPGDRVIIDPIGLDEFERLARAEGGASCGA